MTTLQDTNTRVLYERRDMFIMENITYLNRGDFKQYVKNCRRISRIAAELNRRFLKTEKVTS